MNWIKQNKKLATILGIMIAGGIGLGVWLYLAWAEYSSKMEEWTDMDQKAAKLENAKIYPSDANMKALAEKIADYRDKFNTLQKVLLSPTLQEPVTPMSETDFQAKLKDRSRAVSQKAASKTKLPKDFALGFEDYTGALPPNADVAAELNVQLDASEKFVNTLLDAGVATVESMTRTKLPTERGGTPAPTRPTPPPSPQQRNKPAAPVVQVAPVYDKQTIQCIFTCDQGPLQAVMNNLANPAKTHDFLVVRQLHVENEKQDAPTKEEVKAILKQSALPAGESSGGGDVPPKSVPGTQRTIPPVKEAAPDAADIMGAETLRVYVEVDYLRFRKPPAEGNTAAAPKKP
jgi:hypothetical protein